MQTGNIADAQVASGIYSSVKRGAGQASCSHMPHVLKFPGRGSETFFSHMNN